jgi:hypothetical protein
MNKTNDKKISFALTPRDPERPKSSHQRSEEKATLPSIIETRTPRKKTVSTGKPSVNTKPLRLPSGHMEQRIDLDGLNSILDHFDKFPTATPYDPSDNINLESFLTTLEKVPEIAMPSTSKGLDDFERIEKLLDPDAEIPAAPNEETAIMADDNNREFFPPPTLEEQLKSMRDLKKYVDREAAELWSPQDPRKVVSERESSRSLKRVTTEHAKSKYLAPNSSTKMAQMIGRLIVAYKDGPKSPAVRVLNILLCAAGGKSIFCLPVGCPETGECAKALEELNDDQRPEYLRDLMNELRCHLPEEQGQLVGNHIAVITSCRLENKKFPIDEKMEKLRKDIENLLIG